jgi:hypothetical protein
MLAIVSQVEIIAEREGPKRWEFDMQTLDDAGGLRRVTMTLGWADYNLWSSDGSDAPAKVAEAALLFLMKRGAPDGIPSKFDASFARRKFPDADEVIPKLIRR